MALGGSDADGTFESSGAFASQSGFAFGGRS